MDFWIHGGFLDFLLRLHKGLAHQVVKAARNAACLTQTELENINNQNRRENHPLNCAKLNAARTATQRTGN